WQQKLSVTQNFQWTHKIPEDIARLPGSPWIVGRPSDVGGVGTGSKNEEAGQVCLQGYVNNPINHRFRASFSPMLDLSPIKWMSWSYKAQQTIQFEIVA